jgi:hypothetical protein
MTEKIEKLEEKDVGTAAKVYLKGLQSQNPPSSRKLDGIKKELAGLNCYVHKTNDEIDGLVSFSSHGKKIDMNFICSFKKGVGTQLMNTLADIAEQENIQEVNSIVSAYDEKAIGLYEKCGFTYEGEKNDKGVLLFNIKATPHEIKKALKTSKKGCVIYGTSHT